MFSSYQQGYIFGMQKLGMSHGYEDIPRTPTPEEYARRVADAEWRANNAAASKAVYEDVLKKKNFTIDELNRGFADQKQHYLDQTAKLRGEHGAMSQELGNMGRPTRWFGKLSPMKKGLVGGAAGLGTLGLGLGLGHALSGD